MATFWSKTVQGFFAAGWSEGPQALGIGLGVVGCPYSEQRGRYGMYTEVFHSLQSIGQLWICSASRVYSALSWSECLRVFGAIQSRFMVTKLLWPRTQPMAEPCKNSLLKPNCFASKPKPVQRPPIESTQLAIACAGQFLQNCNLQLLDRVSDGAANARMHPGVLPNIHLVISTHPHAAKVADLEPALVRRSPDHSGRRASQEQLVSLWHSGRANRRIFQ